MHQALENEGAGQHGICMKNFPSNRVRLLKKRRTNMNIYVGNLSSDVTDEAIRDAFVSFGQVTSARVIKDKYTGQSRGFGFVEMGMQSQAQTAIKSLNGKELMGKEMSVSEARPRRDEGRTGGGRMDYSGSRNRY